MAERRFYIMEATAYAEGAPTITESELLHRIYLIKTMVETGQSLTNLNKRAIDILFHGDREKGEEPPDGYNQHFDRFSSMISTPDQELGTREWTPKQLAKHLMEHPECEVSMCKPTPSPTRAEWEAWVWSCADVLCTSAEHRQHIYQVMMSMPIVPKE